jgi:hypothetical protein
VAAAFPDRHLRYQPGPWNRYEVHAGTSRTTNGTGEREQLDHNRLCGPCSRAEALAVAANKGRTAMKNPIFWLALVAGNLAAAWIIVIWRYTGREHAEAVLMNSIPLVLLPVCALLVLALAVWIVGRVWKLATK